MGGVIRFANIGEQFANFQIVTSHALNMRDDITLLERLVTRKRR